jgi:branched-chain amino acid transport system ATP-binding protein
MSPILELKDLRKSFGKTEIIRGVNLAVNAGERVAIIGPNGAGKSTLFNLMSGRFEPTSGQILLNGQSLNGKKPFEINRLGLSRSFQITNIFPKLSVFENLRCGVLWSLGYKYSFWNFLADLDDANNRADELMEMIKLDKKRDVLAINLTYAEQRALEIGITIAGGASVILLDAVYQFDQKRNGWQNPADGGARYGRGVWPGRQDSGGRVRGSAGF